VWNAYDLPTICLRTRNTLTGVCGAVRAPSERGRQRPTAIYAPGAAFLHFCGRVQGGSDQVNLCARGKSAANVQNSIWSHHIELLVYFALTRPEHPFFLPAAGVQGRTAARRFGQGNNPLGVTKTRWHQPTSFIHFQEFLRIFGSGQLETEPQTRQNVGPAAKLLAGLRIPEISWSSPGLSNRYLANLEDFQVSTN
jgi:hypothetical protein